jgi:hypothetical protein
MEPGWDIPTPHFSHKHVPFLSRIQKPEFPLGIKMKKGNEFPVPTDIVKEIPFPDA